MNLWGRLELKSTLVETNQRPAPLELASQTSMHCNYDKASNESRIASYRLHGYSKQIFTLAKLYVNQWKYSGNGDKFDYIFDTLLKHCENADVPRAKIKTIFRIILKDEALEF